MMEKHRGLSSWIWIGLVGILFTISALLIRFKIYEWSIVNNNVELNEDEARTIAEAMCIKGGEALEEGVFNNETNTWWFDANLNTTQAGCSPSCVVNTNTRSAEINWRCTGLISPTTIEINRENIDSFEKCILYTQPTQIEMIYPRRCYANGQIFVEKVETTLDQIKCEAYQSNIDMCAMIYQPVCAEVEVQCIKAPCEPIKQTYGNSCEACRNKLVSSYTNGPCSDAYKTLESIRDLFIEKYPEKKSSMIIKIDEEVDNHARGSISFELGKEGGLWLAVKQGGNWRIVFEGNGGVDCEELKIKYSFSNELLQNLCE